MPEAQARTIRAVCAARWATVARRVMRFSVEHLGQQIAAFERQIEKTMQAPLTRR